MRGVIIGAIIIGALFLWYQLRQLKRSKKDNDDERGNRREKAGELDAQEHDE